MPEENQIQTPLIDAYQQGVDNGSLKYNAEQAQIVEHFQDLSHRLEAHKPAKKTKDSKGWFGFGKKKKDVAEDEPNVVKGLYIWGGVGVGKTHVMDMFYRQLNVDKKMRVHFHRFMQMIHLELSKNKGITDPLEKVADKIAADARVICLDEMFVTDITDAMILGGLFDALFKRGISLAMTSNIDPDHLYKDGLQRKKFLPAIELLKKHTKVINVTSDDDYRLMTLKNRELYLIHEGDETNELLQRSFERLTGAGAKERSNIVNINHRPINACNRAGGVVWFKFEDLCQTNRATEDYIEISTLFHSVIISEIPIMDDYQADAVRRLINLIDEIYDRNVNLIISAEADVYGLYTGEKLAMEFERTKSRLTEMQSKEYMAKRNWH